MTSTFWYGVPYPASMAAMDVPVSASGLGHRPVVSNRVCESFIAALSVLSIVNIVLVLVISDPDVKNVVTIVDTGLCFVFFADFLGRLQRAESKRGYFFRGLGWLDLLGSLPFPGVRIARIFRVVRVVRLVHTVGMKTLVNK